MPSLYYAYSHCSLSPLQFIITFVIGAAIGMGIIFYFMKKG